MIPKNLVNLPNQLFKSFPSVLVNPAFVHTCTDLYEFEWNKGNINKNLKLHNVSDEECEEIFFDPHKKVLKDALHSTNEERYILIGKTKLERLLFLIFTVRKNKIRVISSKNLNKKEKYLYEQKT